MTRYCQKCGKKLVLRGVPLDRYNSATGEMMYHIYIEKCPDRESWFDEHWSGGYYLIPPTVYEYEVPESMMKSYEKDFAS